MRRSRSGGATRTERGTSSRIAAASCQASTTARRQSGRSGTERGRCKRVDAAGVYRHVVRARADGPLPPLGDGPHSPLSTGAVLRWRDVTQARVSKRPLGSACASAAGCGSPKRLRAVPVSVSGGAAERAGLRARWLPRGVVGCRWASPGEARARRRARGVVTRAGAAGRTGWGVSGWAVVLPFLGAAHAARAGARPTARQEGVASIYRQRPYVDGGWLPGRGRMWRTKGTHKPTSRYH